MEHSKRGVASTLGPLRTTSVTREILEEVGSIVRDARLTSSERGYGSRWKAARASYLASHPLCVNPWNRHESIASATTVDHIIPHKGNQALFWNRRNWQALCSSCHSYKTSAFDGGFGNRVSTTPPVANVSQLDANGGITHPRSRSVSPRGHRTIDPGGNETPGGMGGEIAGGLCHDDRAPASARSSHVLDSRGNNDV